MKLKTFSIDKTVCQRWLRQGRDRGKGQTKDETEILDDGWT